MQTSFSFKNLSAAEKALVEKYWSTPQKMGKVQELVDRLYSDVTLEIRVERFVKKSAYKVSLIIQHPLNEFVSEDDHTLPEAIDLAKDKLVIRLRKTQAKTKYDIGGRN